MNYLKSKILNFSNIKHAFSLRVDGVSSAPWNSLNCSYFVGDNQKNVERNRKKFLHNLGFKKTFYINQVHGKKVVNAEDYFNGNKIIKADAIICENYDLPITLTTADCAPILFADPVKGIIGAAHAGWRGAIEGITDNLIDMFYSKGSNPKNIHGVIGPCIGKESFEVKDDMINIALQKDATSEKFFNQVSNLYYFDLPGYLLSKIKSKGIYKIGWIGEDTYKNPQKFFSYRYEMQNNNQVTGRMISVIGLTKN